MHTSTGAGNCTWPFDALTADRFKFGPGNSATNTAVELLATAALPRLGLDATAKLLLGYSNMLLGTAAD